LARNQGQARDACRGKNSVVEPDRIAEIKKLALVAMFSDDKLLDTLVLKGGNLLDLVYGIASRSSIDLDFSMEGELREDEKEEVQATIREALERTFSANGYTIFDTRFGERPKHVSEGMRDFWGGYRFEFKVIETDRYRQLEGRARDRRVQAADLGPHHRKAFRIDISKFEYCAAKRAREIEGRTVYVYSPRMMVFEKLRAICQQMPEYRKKVSNPSQSARARDFFDIYTILTGFTINIVSQRSGQLARAIFAAKHVPLRLIGEIHRYREYHRPDFAAVEATVKPGVLLKSFDFYFDYVIEHCCRRLKPLWEE